MTSVAWRLLAVVIVSVTVSGLAFVALHGLVPEAFEDRHPVPVETLL